MFPTPIFSLVRWISKEITTSTIFSRDVYISTKVSIPPMHRTPSLDPPELELEQTLVNYYLGT